MIFDCGSETFYVKGKENKTTTTTKTQMRSAHTSLGAEFSKVGI